MTCTNAIDRTVLGVLMPRKTHKLERHEFRSTRVQAAWWDAGERKLLVLFADGTRWNYFGVSQTTWRRFIAAGSAGRFVTDVLDSFPNRPA